MPGRDGLLDAGYAVPVGSEIQKREQYRKGLLHAQDSTEGPFAMELDHRLEHWGVAIDSLIGNDMLTGIVAFGRAVP